MFKSRRPDQPSLANREKAGRVEALLREGGLVAASYGSASQSIMGLKE